MSLRPDEHFAIVPLWLIESKISDRALRLYCVLGCFADYETGRCNPGRKTLAGKMGCSTDTVDRVKAELVRAGALTVVRNSTTEAGHVPNDYVLHRVSPEVRKTLAAGARVADRDPSRTDAAQTREERDRSSSSSSAQGSLVIDGVSVPAKVGGKKVSREEAMLAAQVLTAFNKTFAKDFRAKEHLVGIVERIRERPAMTLEEHRGAIEKLAGQSWWRTDRSTGRAVQTPTPRHLYGSGRALDFVLNADGSEEPPSDDGLGAYR